MSETGATVGAICLGIEALDRVKTSDRQTRYRPARESYTSVFIRANSTAVDEVMAGPNPFVSANSSQGAPFAPSIHDQAKFSVCRTARDQYLADIHGGEKIGIRPMPEIRTPRF